MPLRQILLWETWEYNTYIICDDAEKENNTYSPKKRKLGENEMKCSIEFD